MMLYTQNLSFLLNQWNLTINEFENRIHIPKVRIMEPYPDELVRIADFFKLPVDLILKKDLKLEAAAKNKNIKLVILDVDGTMTDGGMYFFEDGNQLKRYNAKDGLAIMSEIKKGRQFGIISHGRKLQMVQDRASLLGIQKVYVGTASKKEILQGWCDELNIRPEEIAFIGDDLNDLEIIDFVGLSACPSDSLPEVKKRCNIVLKLGGGQGCIREFVDEWLGEMN